MLIYSLYFFTGRWESLHEREGEMRINKIVVVTVILYSHTYTYLMETDKNHLTNE